MSDTDSENEYESADEHTENDIDVIPSIEEQKEAIEIKSSDVTTLNENTNNNTTDNAITEENTINIRSKNDNLPTEQCDSDVEKQSSHKLSNTNETITLPTESQISKLPSTKEEKKNKEPSRDNSDEIITEDGKIVKDVPSKRVTLRLEQKIQQKNQSAAESCDKNSIEKSSSSSSWGFSSWGTSLLSTAASSVSTFTNQVSQGIGTVLETVETSLGAPPPEDLAKVLKERRDVEIDPKEDICEKPNSNDEDEDIPSSGSLFTGITSVTKVIESTGSKVLMGGLDTLELIGKKTFNLITDGDPGLRMKRSAFSSGVTLSQVLREAKDKAEEHSDSATENDEDSVNFSTFFDEFQGLVHLEALEMLSAQSQTKVQGALMVMSGESDIKEKLDQVKNIFEDMPSDIPENETQDFEGSLTEHLQHLPLKINMQKIITVRTSVHQWLDMCAAEQDAGHVKNAKDLYRHAINSLAEFSAKCVEQFHKIGELILVQTDSDFDGLNCATQLAGLTSVLCIEVGIISAKYSQCLNTAADDSEDPDSITPLITNVYLESSNSTTYIQDAVVLLQPVIQATILH